VLPRPVIKFVSTALVLTFVCLRQLSSAARTACGRHRARTLDAVGDWSERSVGPPGARTPHAAAEPQSWTKQKCPDMAARNYLPAPLEAGSTLLRIDASSVNSHRNETYIAALSAVTFAVKSIDLTMAYFSPDSQLEDALRDASRRGAKVRLLLPGLSDFGGIVEAGRAHYSSCSRTASRSTRSGVHCCMPRRSRSTASGAPWDRPTGTG
jgi:phosphatidylserine/phosphatidylglycerophosphate/cardiolipin synthase-like enzyme